MSRCTTPARVRVLERARRPRGRRARPATDVSRVAGVEHAAEAAALEQLEHHERHVVLAPVVDRHDVRVVQRRRDLRLGAEAAEEPGVVGERGVQHLHRDAAPQADVVGDVDATARAGADRREQAVAAGEDAAGEVGDAGDRHRVQRYRPHSDAKRGTPDGG